VNGSNIPGAIETLALQEVELQASFFDEGRIWLISPFFFDEFDEYSQAILGRDQ
jgi:hypothetical protein